MGNQGFSQRGMSLALSLSLCSKGIGLFFFYLQALNTREYQRVLAQ